MRCHENRPRHSSLGDGKQGFRTRTVLNLTTTAPTHITMMQNTCSCSHIRICQSYGHIRHIQTYTVIYVYDAGHLLLPTPDSRVFFSHFSTFDSICSVTRTVTKSFLFFFVPFHQSRDGPAMNACETTIANTTVPIHITMMQNTCSCPCGSLTQNQKQLLLRVGNAGRREKKKA